MDSFWSSACHAQRIQISYTLLLYGANIRHDLPRRSTLLYCMFIRHQWHHTLTCSLPPMQGRINTRFRRKKTLGLYVIAGHQTIDWNQSVWWPKRVGWDGLDMLNVKMIMTGSNVVWRGKLKELDREDARKRPGGIVLRMTWKVWSVPKDVQSRNKWRKGIKGQRLTQVHVEKGR